MSVGERGVHSDMCVGESDGSGVCVWECDGSHPCCSRTCMRVDMVSRVCGGE
jgi:hypothetical protein